MRNKIEESIQILKLLGLPRQQLNDRSGLVLLSLISLRSEEDWSEISDRPMLGVTPMMEWIMSNYDVEYKPNTRETFRRQTLHQLVEGGLVLYNPDKPDRPVNSPKTCYQITEELFVLLKTFNTKEFQQNLKSFLSEIETLKNKYSKVREVEMIPLKLKDGSQFKLSPGKHSQLIVDIVEKFGPIFCPGSEVMYLGDTGSKVEFFNDQLLRN